MKDIASSTEVVLFPTVVDRFVELGRYSDCKWSTGRSLMLRGLSRQAYFFSKIKMLTFHIEYCTRIFSIHSISKMYEPRALVENRKMKSFIPTREITTRELPVMRWMDGFYLTDITLSGYTMKYH